MTSVSEQDDQCRGPMTIDGLAAFMVQDMLDDLNWELLQDKGKGKAYITV